MQQSPITKKVLLFSLLFSVLITGILFIYFITDNQTKIVFCNVGQGDGTYIRIENKIDIIVDTGPDNGMMLTCLGKYMPFYDKHIEIAILSHLQSDHYGGLKSIVNRYSINHLYISDRETDNKALTQILQNIYKSKGTISVIRAGEQINAHTASFQWYWPPPYLVDNNGFYIIKSSDDNIYSSAIVFLYRNNNILFTGDLPSLILTHIVKSTNVSSNILKVSHHGSQNGTSKDFISLAQPTLAVISVGKDNRYGHPSKVVLDIFKALKIPVRRTDEEGDIVIRLP